MNCSHSNITCDKAAGGYRCQNCQTVTGHFMTFPETRLPAGVAVIGNGLYIGTRGGK